VIRLRIAGLVAVGLACAAGTVFTADTAFATEIHGSARVYGGPTESGGIEADHVDQKYNLNLVQTLGPYLSLRFNYRYSDFRSSGEDVATFERESSEPRFELLYRRETFTGLVSFQDRRMRSAQDFDLQAFLTRFDWRPSRGPELSLQVRDETNVADVEVFGRDVDSSSIDFEATYDRTFWGARYTFRTTDLTNEASGFRLEEERHQVRLRYAQRFFEDKLSFSADTWVSRLDQTEENTTDPAEPVPVREGLFGIDATPEVGELEVRPELVDGDTREPATEETGIGGANTFRNFGVDLGFTRPVSRLAVYVDAPSAADLFWDVYHSSDNESWERLDGVTAQFDSALLRYLLRFPETTDRYFKAVNISVNTMSDVSVTEVRALVDVENLTRRDARSTTYRASLSAVYRPIERVRASLSFGLGNDQDLASSFTGQPGLLSRDLDEVSLAAMVRVGLREDLDLRVGYRLNDVEEKQEPVLKREEDVIFASLDYDPLPTVDVTFTVSRRDEHGGDLFPEGEQEGETRLLRSADTFRLRAGTVLLPSLELVSEVTYSDVEDPFAGFTQSIWRWRETLQGSPTRKLTFWATFGQSYYDSTGTVAIKRRSRFDLRTTWSATPFLSFTGDWSYGDDDRQQTLAQRYSVFWAPGPKLSATFSYQDTESEDLRDDSFPFAGPRRDISSLGASINYRLNPRLMPYANFSRSRFDQAGMQETENTSLRFGFNLFF